MSMATPNSADDSLNRLGISVSTGAPEDILTPNAVKAARFRKSKPWGYLAEDVQNFVDITKSSVQWYRDKLHERDLDVHTLAKEIDERENRIANLNVQLASASYNSNVSEAISRNAEDKEMADLMARQQTLEADLATAQREAADLSNQLAAALAAVPTTTDTPAVTADETELEELRTALTAAQAENTDLQNALGNATRDLEALKTTPVEPTADNSAELAAAHAENAELQAKVTQLEEYNREMENFADQQETYINSLLAQLPQDDDSLVEDAEGQPHDAEQKLAEEESIFEPGAASETEEPEEQTYAADDEEVYEPEPQVEDLDADEEEPENDVPPVADDNVYMYNGVPLPPGIRPEDL